MFRLQMITFLVAVQIFAIGSLFSVEAQGPSPAAPLQVSQSTDQPNRHPAEVTKDRATATGTIKVQGVTSYMYGTHVLVDHTGRTLYDLKSDSLKLDRYVGKEMTVSGKLISGYPVDGGPEYLSVDKIVTAGAEK